MKVKLKLDAKGIQAFDENVEKIGFGVVALLCLLMGLDNALGGAKGIGRRPSSWSRRSARGSKRSATRN